MTRLTEADELAIAEAAIERRIRERIEADLAARLAQPHCCALYWSEHTKACPKRTYSAERAELWRFVRGCAKAVLKGLLR